MGMPEPGGTQGNHVFAPAPTCLAVFLETAQEVDLHNVRIQEAI